MSIGTAFVCAWSFIFCLLLNSKMEEEDVVEIVIGVVTSVCTTTAGGGFSSVPVLDDSVYRVSLFFPESSAT